MAFDEAFWALVALLVFLGVIAYMKVPGMLVKSLDDRADKIRDELEEARRLREEAQELLAEYQRKRKSAETEAEEIVAAAKSEAIMFAEESAKKTEEFVARRTALAEQKIAQAETQAIDDVRSIAVDIAVSAAEKLIAGKVTGAEASKIIDKSIAEVKNRLN
ncbi:MAG: F0F1 ATP synthase subunit B [Salaquimonas sp.]|jgi:F-type H+-transporting ATPase subunit b|nr:F0F1 ATP synthase subunit B [Salaquimonas sp.]